jgi:membrane protein implicated in regulation of membrane protease activity
MTAQIPSDSEIILTPSDDQIVQELLPEVTDLDQSSSIYTVDAEPQASWENNQAKTKAFFSNPGEHLGTYWQQYKPIVIAIALLTVAIIALNFVFSVISFIFAIPLLGGLLNLVGLGYSIWFVKRYLLAAKSRQELYQKIEQAKKDILGTTEAVATDVNRYAQRSATMHESSGEVQLDNDLERALHNIETPVG